MLGLTPDPLSAGVGRRVAVRGSVRPRTGHRVAGRCRRATKEYRRGFRFVWPSTRAGRRPRPPVANDRLRHTLIDKSRYREGFTRPDRPVGDRDRPPDGHGRAAWSTPR